MSQASTYLRRIPFYLGIALILLYILFPVYWMFISSFKNPTTIFWDQADRSAAVRRDLDLHHS